MYDTKETIAPGIIIAKYSNGLEGRTYTDINKVAKLFELNKDEDNVIKYMVKMSDINFYDELPFLDEYINEYIIGEKDEIHN